MTEELFREDGYLQSCEATVSEVTAEGVVLDRTVFYPTGGGQPGDSGVLRGAHGEVAIAEARKKDGGGVLHVPAEGAPVALSVGDRVTAAIDWERRHKHMRMHTCLHLLCALVKGHITGAQVGADKSRIDFNIPESPDKEALQAALDAVIAANHPVRMGWISDAELDANPDLVRTLSVAPPRGTGRVRLIEVDGVDKQPCGGTHVSATGEIGRVRIAKIENKGKQNRRINIEFAE